VASSARVRWLRGVTALAVVFALKLAVLSSLGQQQLLVPAGDLDGAYFYHLAQQVAGGDVGLLRSESWFGQPAPPFFMPPLYIYVLAFLLKASGGWLATARFVQVLLGACAVGLVALTAKRWYGAAAGWWAGLLAGGFGLFTFFEILILPASLDPFLSALDLYLLTRALQVEADAPPRTAMLWWAAAGAAIGLHALNRPWMLIVFGGLVALIAIRALVVRGALRTSKRQLINGLAFALAALVVIAPVTIRNYRASGRFVLISSRAGLNLYIGNGPYANGTYVPALGVSPSMRGQWVEAQRVASDRLGREVTPHEASLFFRDQSLAWMREHPGGEAKLLVTKAWYAISAAFVTINHSYPFFAHDVSGPLAWLVVGPALVVPLGLVGLVVARPRRDGYGVWAAYVPLTMASVVIFFVAARYRLPYQVALCIAAGGGIAWAIERVRARAWVRVAAASGAAILIAVPVLWPTKLDDGRGEEQARKGLQDIQGDRLAEGEAWIDRAVARHPYPGLVQLRAGQMYELRNQPAPALAHYQKALALDPNQPSLRFVAGRVLYQLGRYSEAIVELERAKAGRQADPAVRMIVLALTRLGRTAEANVAVRQLDPARWDAETAREFALGLADVDRVDLSVVAWKRAAEASNDAKDYERLGLTWAMLGNRPLAIAALSNAVERDPRSASIRLNYAVAWAQVGRYADARREAENALKLNPGYERAKEFLRSIAK
jgi:tetratricopeptide (TPR) repeat protein